MTVPNTVGMARLDTQTWTFHHEPPSAVDVAVDRRARNHLAWAEMSSITVLVVLVLCVLPPLRELGLAVLLLLLIFVFPTAIVSLFRHRALRKITGAPVISELVPMIQPTAEMLAANRAMFQELLAMPPEDTDPATLAEAHEIGKGGLRNHRRIARHLLRYFELAALYEQWGWTWARDHYIHKLSDLVLTLSQPRASQTDAD